jgi:hypothetical protein
VIRQWDLAFSMISLYTDNAASLEVSEVKRLLFSYSNMVKCHRVRLKGQEVVERFLISEKYQRNSK